jgi:hypothetical protein
MRRALPFLLLCACGHRFGSKDFPGHYQREGDAAMGAPQCGAFEKVVVRDPRPNPQLVGDRSQQDHPGSFAVTMVGDVASWVRDGIEAQLKLAAYDFGNAKAPTLNVTVNTIDLHENVFANADYRARIVLDVAVVLGDGKTCLTTSIEGEGTNYGGEGSPANYAQTLNRALDAISAAMLNMPAIRDASCGKCP